MPYVEVHFVLRVFVLQLCWCDDLVQSQFSVKLHEDTLWMRWICYYQVDFGFKVRIGCRACGSLAKVDLVEKWLPVLAKLNWDMHGYGDE